MRRTNIPVATYFDGLPASVKRWLIVAALLVNVGLALTIAIRVAILVAGVNR